MPHHWRMFLFSVPRLIRGSQCEYPFPSVFCACGTVLLKRRCAECVCVGGGGGGE